MPDDKRSRGTNCRSDCPGRAAPGKPKKRDKLGPVNQKGGQQYRRKRQNLVCNPEEEVWHEPYMQPLVRELCQASMLCDSKIELPWKDIAVTSAGGKTRPEVGAASETDDAVATSEIGRKESTGLMKLPWSDLVIEEVVMSVPARSNGTAKCDSSLEIPWSDLIIDNTVKIAPIPKEKSCQRPDVEVPWDAILVPRNLVIESKTRKHPSSSQPPRKSDKRSQERCCRLACRARDV